LTTVFGSGADTCSYQDIEHTDVIFAWGSNTQEAHPIIYNYMRRGVKNGAKLVVIDPRKVTMANNAHAWLPVQPGTDIALANAMGHVIIKERLYDAEFVVKSTQFFDDYQALVETYTPEFAESVTGVSAEVIRQVARLYASSSRAVIAWTLGITEHQDGTNHVHSLINLALLTGHVGRQGSGLMPLRGQNNVQGGADMGALPNMLPGFFRVTDDAARSRFETAWNCSIPAKNGLHLAGMFDAMKEGQMHFMYVIGENPARSDANTAAVVESLNKVDFLVVQDLFMTETARQADVVLPAAGWAEVDGTFTNSERGVQRARKMIAPPGEARDDLLIIQDIANRLGAHWNYQSVEDVWTEVRNLSPAHRGITYERLEKVHRLQWPCTDVDAEPVTVLHTRLHETDITDKAPFVPVDYQVPSEPVDADFPFILITGRRLAFYNTGVTSSDYGSSVKDQHEYLEINTEDARRMHIQDGQTVEISSRRGTVSAPVKISQKMQPGHVFLSFHFPEQVNTNLLTNDAYDKKSGVAPYKYTAVRITV
jgi:predicted molibdopterin-dependent oxidoreductase YjgC